MSNEIRHEEFELNPALFIKNATKKFNYKLNILALGEFRYV